MGVIAAERRGKPVARMGSGLIAVGFGAAVILLLLASPPSVRAGAIFDNSFLSSSSGTSTIAIGESISFETFITVDPGAPIAVIWMLFTGDITEALADPTPCPHGAGRCFDTTSSLVTGWEFAFDPGAREKSVGLTRTLGTGNPHWNDGPGHSRVALGTPVYDAFSGLFPLPVDTIYEGNGSRSLMGTVTITANTAGNFNAGPLLYNEDFGVLVWVEDPEVHIGFSGVFLRSTVIPGNYTVVPEPETGFLLTLGIALLTIKRKHLN